MQTKLSILIVNYNTADFIEISLYALSKLTKNAYKVFILDNNSEQRDYKKLKKITNKLDNIFLERHPTKLAGEIAHGVALNYLCNKVDTPYFVILDPDAIWLRKNWDEILISHLDNRIKVVGTQAVGSRKYTDFPIVYAALFETKSFKKSNIDFRPQKEPGVGSELRKKYLRAGFKGKIIEMKNTRTYKRGPFNNIICAEYYLDGDYEHIFASHFSRGATLGANKYIKTWKKYLYKIPILGKPMLVKRGEKEKNKWIKVCKKIIDSQ